MSEADGAAWPRSLVGGSWMGAGASVLDRAFRAAILTRPNARSDEAKLGPVERIRRLRELAQRVALFDGEPTDRFFPVPAEVRPTLRPRGRYTTVRFASPHRLRRWDDALTARWNRYRANGTMDARWIHADAKRPDAPRPVCILLHGYLGGVHGFEERLWPLGWFRKRGIDVLLATLPFHGPRREPNAVGAPPFPAGDPRFTIEGFRQAMIDLRTLVRWARQRGAPAVGAMGMSLGGYSTALLSTIEPLDFAVPFIPLAAIEDFARDAGRLTGTRTQQAEQYDLLVRIYGPVSPLRRPSQVAPEGRLIVAAAHDRITPLSHARRLAEHLDAPMEIFGGAHLLQVGRQRGFRRFARLMHELGLTR